jgi:hypothetical protein
MIGKPVTLIQVPNKRLFQVAAAARYLGISPNSLRKYADLGLIRALKFDRRRVFDLEDLNRFVASLPCYDSCGERPGSQKEK